MNYLTFLLVFLGLPIAALLLTMRRQVGRFAWAVLALTALMALLYTAPWDNAMIRNGVWSFAPKQVMGSVLGVAPIEEYLFYILQVLLTGLFTLWLLRRVSLRHIRE